MKMRINSSIPKSIYRIYLVLLSLLFITAMGKVAWLSLGILVGFALAGYMIGIFLCELHRHLD